MDEKLTYEELEKKFKLVADHTHSWEYWIGPDSKLIYVSPSCKDHTGYTQQQFMDNEELFFDIIHPEDKELISNHVEHEKNSPPVESIEFRLIGQDGRIRWISHACQPVYDEEGVFLGRRASNWDITDQKQAEKERDESIRRLKKASSLINTVFNAIPDVLGIQDLDHRIVRYNKAGYSFLGMTPSDVHGKKCFELIGQKIPCDICATSEVYKTKKPAQVERYFKEINKWLDVRAYPVFDDAGNLFRIIEHLRDISKEKNAEIRLKEAHERLITVLNSIDAHIYVADIDTYEILFMNKKMIEYYNDNFVGEKCYESFRQEKQPCDICSNYLLVDENGSPTGVHTWQGKNTITNRWYMNFDRAINWVDGRIVRIQIAMDITESKQHEEEHKQMEKQLHQAQKLEAIGTLAGGIAHDFNNILMGIQGRASLMTFDLESNHPCNEHLNAIMEYTKSASDLTAQLLGFARRGKYEVKPININDVVIDSSNMFGRTKKEISIRKKFCDPPPIAMVDRRQIEQVLLNIYINAWQAIVEKGKIDLETSIVHLDENICEPHSLSPGSYVRISVTDNGIGMDENTRHRVFDPFFTTKTMGRGTGLGLASAYGIVKNHSGMITVESKIGVGSTFNVYLPYTDQKIRDERDINHGLINGTETVLLVDDEQMIIEVGKALLEKLGYQVITANSGKQAIEEIRKNKNDIDLMILDLIMPDMDGSATFDRVRNIKPSLPVLLSSGYSLSTQAEEVMRKGCNGFIQKPFLISELSQKLREVLASSKNPN